MISPGETSPPTLRKESGRANISTNASAPRQVTMLTQTQALDRISIELTNACAKACWFCYDCLPAA